jgi:hypothetical protein
MSKVNVTGVNAAAVQAAFDKTLSRDGTLPNAMEAPLDMNSNRVINLPEAATPSEPVRKAEFDAKLDTIDGAVQSASDAAISANLALDTFTDIWLGSKPTDPVVDNDSNPLQNGAIYFSTALNAIRVYKDSVWVTGVLTNSGGGGGVTDHGALTGLVDDDHTQYHTNARGDARYSALGHSHSIANVTGLQTALDNKIDDNQATAFGLSVLNSADNATARINLGLGSAATTSSSAYAAAIHSHSVGDVTSLQTALDSKAETVHTHVVSDVTGLQAELDTKQEELVSAVNIKTVNGASLLGSGDVTISSAGVTWTSAVLNIPNGVGFFEYTQTISDVSVLPTSVVLLKLSNVLDVDENDPELLSLQVLNATPATGSFEVLATFTEKTSGPIKIHYTVGA